jgi:hypothetical protein
LDSVTHASGVRSRVDELPLAATTNTRPREHTARFILAREPHDDSYRRAKERDICFHEI